LTQKKQGFAWIKSITFPARRLVHPADNA
jgi:hypothetical protein